MLLLLGLENNMAGEIIDDVNANDELVHIGEKQKLSIQVLQDIYNEFTGKTEVISNSFSLHHKTTYNDISDLNSKIMQLCEQYHIVSQNMSVTIYFVKEGRVQYSSFERFKIVDTKSDAIENIRLKYDFLIVLPKTKRSQTYSVEVNIHSRAAIYQSESNFPKHLLFNLASITGHLKIEFVDYAVALSFSSTIESWFRSLPQSEAIFGLKYLQGKSEHFPFIFKNISFLIMAAFLYINYRSWFYTDIHSLSSLFQASILCFSLLFVVSNLATKLGETLEKTIDFMQPISYLKLSRGDDAVIKKLEKSNRKNVLNIVLTIIGTIVLNIITPLIAIYVGIN
jgi:hypothetical protein